MPTVPDDYTITIRIDDTDVTQYVPYDSIEFEDDLRDVSSFRFRLENPGITVSEGQILSVFENEADGDPAIFEGMIVTADRKRRKNSIVYEYDIEALDYKERLQKSSIEYNDFTGSDADIIADLFGATYPTDIADLFDYTSGVTSVLPSMDFSTMEDSLLDALKDLEDRTGANMSFKRKPIFYRVNFGGTDTLSAFTGSYPAYQYGTTILPLPTTDGVTAGGNPGNCYTAAGTGAITALTEYVAFTFMLRPPAGQVSFVNVTFDLYFNFDAQDCFVQIVGASSTPGTTIAAANKNTWLSLDAVADIGMLGFDGDDIQIVVRPSADMPFAAWEVRLDNLRVYFRNKTAATELGWDDTPEAAEYSIDVPTSAEYVWDLDFKQGNIDKINSVIVTGGIVLEAIDWTYSGNGSQTHFPLSTGVKSLAVYKNTGSDVSPSWTAQALGEHGVDTLTGSGGTKDVLYNSRDSWLLFNTAPSDMTKAIRITGSVEKQIRVRVENAATDEKIKVGTIYDEKLTTTDAAAAAGYAELQRRNAPTRLSFSTHNPGLKVGKLLTITDTDIAEEIKIRKIRTTWVGPSKALFEVECGNDDEISLDTMLADNDRRSRKKAKKGSITTQAATAIRDDSGNVIRDDNNQIIYEDLA